MLLEMQSRQFIKRFCNKKRTLAGRTTKGRVLLYAPVLLLINLITFLNIAGIIFLIIVRQYLLFLIFSSKFFPF